MPPYVELEWLTQEMADQPEALVQTRRAHDQERDRASYTEGKASSMATLALTLLATALLIAGYQVNFLRNQHQSLLSWELAPAVLSIAFISMNVITCLEVQRVGIYLSVGAEPLGRPPAGALAILRQEELGRRYAAWTAKVKVNQLMQARAWLSRALVALILSAVIAIGMATRPSEKADTSPATISSTATVQCATTLATATVRHLEGERVQTRSTRLAGGEGPGRPLRIGSNTR